MSTPAPKSRDPKDQLPFDAQGDLTDEERVKGAVKMFVRDFGRTAATYMDACVHCGYCAEACHFYLTTEDPKYTPIHKIAPFKKAYRREVGPFAPLMKLLTPEVSIDELEEWQHLIYDSCTLCGRCSMACPMGIDIPALVESARHGMYEAGLVPYRLSQIVENAVKNEGSQSATPAEFIEAIERYREEYGVWMPLDEEEADILLTVSAGQIEEGHAIAEMARILNHTGVSWTLSSIVVDPITRIEGHLRIEAQMDGNNIEQAYSPAPWCAASRPSCAGRDPRDAWAFAQRICGVCTLVHGMAGCARSRTPWTTRSRPTPS
jgi:ferredoxin